MIYLPVKCGDIHLGSFKVIAERHFHLLPLTVTLTLGMAALILNAIYLLIMFYLSVKFH